MTSLGNYRRAQIVRFIGDFHAKHGYYATVREITIGVGLASTSSTHMYLCELVKEERLRRLRFTVDKFVYALPEAP